MGGRGSGGAGKASGGGGVGASQIRNAYDKLKQGDIQWVGLADLRRELAPATHAQVDAALMRMLENRQIRLIPEENQKTLTAADHAASIRVSGDPKHLIGIIH